MLQLLCDSRASPGAPQRIESTLGVAPDYSAELALIKEAKAKFPDNIAMKHFNIKYFESLSPDLQVCSDTLFWSMGHMALHRREVCKL